MDMNDAFESDVRSISSSSSRGERRRILREGAEKKLMNRGGKRDVGDQGVRGVRSDELQKKIEQDFQNLAVYDEGEKGMRSFVQVMDRRNLYESHKDNFRGAQGMDNEGVRYSKKGPLKFFATSGYHYGYPVDGFDSTEHEHLKLEGLKDQLNQSWSANSRKEKVPLDRRMAYQEMYDYENRNTDELLGRNQASVQSSYHKSQFERQRYQNHFTDPPPSIHMQEMLGYHSQYPRNHAQGYGSPLRSQMLRGTPYPNPAHYHHKPSDDYIPDRYMNDNQIYMGTKDSYSPNVRRHHPSCSCFQCHENSDGLSNDMMFNTHDDKNVAFGEYSLRTSNLLAVRGRDRRFDVSSEVDRFNHFHPHRMHLSSSRKYFHPVSGGAPIILCHNCFELLLLPEKVLKQNGDQRKIRCGGCSTVIIFAISNKNLFVLNDDVKAIDVPEKAEKNPISVSMGDGQLNQAGATLLSDDYDDFSAMNQELGPSSIGHGRDNRLKNSGNHTLTSTNTDEPGEGGENLAAPRKYFDSVDSKVKDKRQPPPTGIPDDKVLPNKASSMQNSMTRMSPATEIDILSNEYTNPGTTFGFGEGSRGYHGNDRRDRSNGSTEIADRKMGNVTINGYLIRNQLLRKAEQLAGLIEPGHYWYDFRAGFWGVMGGPCLGIIPPSITEFNYLMPDKCSGGNTGIFVNGRELCLTDLNLLRQRGLPPDKGKSYVVEISGRTIDADTGVELQTLGKLAPSVEKAKQGLGMRDPNAAAQVTGF